MKTAALRTAGLGWWWLRTQLARLRGALRLPEGDLLRESTYRRLWSAILISSFGAQITMLALPLTAALLLQATPTQMGLLTAMEIMPFVLFSLPSGVWLDRVRKLPVYIAGEIALALAIVTVPLAAHYGLLSMPWLYVIGFVIGTLNTTAGSASQIVLTQVVSRDRLVEAHAKNALATSGADVAGPGLAGALIRLLGAPVALLVDAVLLLASALVLRRLPVFEVLTPRPDAHFWRDLRAGVRFVVRKRMLVTLAAVVGGWQMCHHAVVGVLILYATRTLGLSEDQVGMAYVGLGGGTVMASVFGSRISRALGPGPSLVFGVALCAVGWCVLALAPAGRWGVAAFAANLLLFGFGAVLLFINFLALRQSVTPEGLLGRMTSTIRWLILIPAGPGALIGGWLGEHYGLRAALAFSGGAGLLIAALAWQLPLIRSLRQLPTPVDIEGALGADAAVRSFET